MNMERLEKVFKQELDLFESDVRRETRTSSLRYTQRELQEYIPGLSGVTHLTDAVFVIYDYVAELKEQIETLKAEKTALENQVRELTELPY